MPYLAHFGLEDHPFTLTPNVDYFFPTQEHANIIGSVEFALRRDTGIIKVVGDVGTGKTLLCRLLIKKLIDSEAVAYINAPRANAKSIVLAVCKEFGLDVGEDADAAYGALNQFLVEEHAKNRLAVLVVDEAQHLGREGLELVRLISNLETDTRKLLQIVLFGQTELDELLADPSLRQLTQRIAFSLGTKPLTVAESKSYINHRISVSRRPGVEYEVFSARAVDLLARSCGGVPRVINIIADKSLLAAFAAGSPVVQPAHVAEAIKESPTLVKPVAARQKWWRRLLGRGTAIFGGIVALAAAAVIVLALIPAGHASSSARSLLRSLGGALTGIADRTTPATAVMSPSPAPTVSPSPAPAVTTVQAPAPTPVTTTPTPGIAVTTSVQPSPAVTEPDKTAPAEAPKADTAKVETPKTEDTVKVAVPALTGSAAATTAPASGASAPAEAGRPDFAHAEPAHQEASTSPQRAEAAPAAVPPPTAHHHHHKTVAKKEPPPPETGPVQPAKNGQSIAPTGTMPAAATMSVAAEHPSGPAAANLVTPATTTAAPTTEVTVTPLPPAGAAPAAH